jgi:hypothetical protein
VGRLLRRVEFVQPLGLLGGGDDQPATVCAEVERRLGIDLQQVENRPVDYQRQDVSVYEPPLPRTYA